MESNVAVLTQCPNAIAQFVASLVMLATIWPARQGDSAWKMEHGVGWLQLVKVSIMTPLIEEVFLTISKLANLTK